LKGNDFCMTEELKEFGLHYSKTGKKKKHKGARNSKSLGQAKNATIGIEEGPAGAGKGTTYEWESRGNGYLGPSGGAEGKTKKL